MRILHVVGARPNFMKAAPVLRAIREFPRVEQILVHTGQHYDNAMSDIFFRQLEIPEPDINLQIGSGTQTQQTAHIMSRFESVVVEKEPDWVVVYGDVTSTLAASLVCAKLGVRIAHVEAGLRSGDRSMPEEINRIITDQLADVLFTPSGDADENLIKEGLDPKKIHFVGNVMIDTLVRMLPDIDEHAIEGMPAEYILVTMHRPANVDNPEWLAALFDVLKRVSAETPVVFPLHPRTRQRIDDSNLSGSLNGIQLLPPVPYMEFLYLQKHASLVVTDSGGIQEETTFLGVPCLTVRDNTERPVTVKLGTNKLVGTNTATLEAQVRIALAANPVSRTLPPLWDGNAAHRIADVIVKGTKSDCGLSIQESCAAS